MSSSLNNSTTINLSDIDRKVLQILLSPNGNLKSSSISKELGVPINTIRRRRKRLESEFLKSYYVLDIEKFDGDVLINSVANKLLDIDEVTYIGKSIREHTIDLRIETIVKDNVILLGLLEKIKGIEGVNDVIWSEFVSSVGRKKSIPSLIIDQLRQS